MELCSTVGETGNGTGIGDDLWYEILSKLPLKPLMISKCVCKSWHQLASNIIIQSIPKNPISGFFVAGIECLHYIPIKRNDDDDDDDEKKKRSCTNHYDSVTSLPSNPRTQIADSREGFLLCSSNYLQKDYFLYNPVTRQRVSLPTAPIPGNVTTVNAMDVTAKLVFDDDSSDSYRVIRVAIGYGNFDEADWPLRECIYDNSPHMFVDIYSSETGKWTMSKELELPRYHFPPYSVFFAGGIYLLADDSKYGSTILRFDVNDESCRFVWSPPGSVLNSSDCLGVCEGRLCYAQHLKQDEGNRVEVWEFDDEKEWVLKFNVKDFRKWKFSVLTFHPYLTAVFVKRLDGFYWYDLATGKLETCYPLFRTGTEAFTKFKAYPFSECYTHRRL